MFPGAQLPQWPLVLRTLMVMSCFPDAKASHQPALWPAGPRRHTDWPVSQAVAVRGGGR